MIIVQYMNKAGVLPFTEEVGSSPHSKDEVTATPSNEITNESLHGAAAGHKDQSEDAVLVSSIPVIGSSTDEESSKNNSQPGMIWQQSALQGLSRNTPPLFVLGKCLECVCWRLCLCVMFV